LEAAEQKRLEQLIESHLNGGKSEFSFATDSELIGGFTVDIDNERLDASVKNELKQLRLKLLKQA
jgi:F-type H+-transporting ATPase subunit delta